MVCILTNRILVKILTNRILVKVRISNCEICVEFLDYFVVPCKCSVKLSVATVAFLFCLCFIVLIKVLALPSPCESAGLILTEAVKKNHNRTKWRSILKLSMRASASPGH